MTLNWTKITEDGASIAKTLKYVLKALRVLGIGPLFPQRSEPQTEKKTKISLTSRQSLYNKLAWIIVQVWIIRLLLRLALVLSGRGKVGEAAVDVLRGWAASVAFNRFVLYRWRLCHFFWSVDHINDGSDTYGTLPSFTSFYTVGTGIYLLVRLILDIVNVFTTAGFKNYVEQWFILDSIAGTLPTLVYLVAVPDIVIRRCVLTGPTSFLVSFYVQVMWVVPFKFNAFDRALKRDCASSSNIRSDRLRQLRVRHADLCLLVQDLDDIMSPLAFLWHAMVVLGSCAEATHLLQLKPSEDIMATVDIFLDLVYLGFLFVFVSFSAASVCKSYDSAVNEVNYMSARLSRVDDAEFTRQALLLVSQMQAANVSVTA
ncbi:unnamed protein product [Ixodes hexagonus]